MQEQRVSGGFCVQFRVFRCGAAQPRLLTCAAYLLQQQFNIMLTLCCFSHIKQQNVNRDRRNRGKQSRHVMIFCHSSQCVRNMTGICEHVRDFICLPNGF